MPTPRVDHAMLAVSGRLYVCGGWWEDLDSGNRVLVDTIDRYDAASDSWHVVTRVPTPRYHAGIVTVNSTIYFIGGFHSDAMFDRASGTFQSSINVDLCVMFEFGLVSLSLSGLLGFLLTCE